MTTTTDSTTSQKTSFAAEKALHTRIRADMHAAERGELITTSAGYRERVPHRIMLLVWAFARGLPYRRIEARRRMQTLADGQVFEHGAPRLGLLQAEAEKYLPHATLAALRDWLSEPAKPLPTRMPKPTKRESAAA